MRRLGTFFLVLLSAVLGGVIALGAYMQFFAPDTNQSIIQQTDQPFVQTNYTNPTNPTFAPGSIDFVEAAERATPAVVHIQTFGNASYIRQGARTPMEELLREFFGDGYIIPDQGRQKQNEVRLGAGSGVVIQENGYIVTNNHVIDKATRIDVVLSDQRRYEAKLIGTDPTTDLALLKIDDATDLKAIPFGDSDALKVGEWVLAVGNPFDLTSTVTAGIVSAKGRNINILRRKDGLAIESFIQTDAAVNPGNSGGALVNTKGELVGINTAIASQTGSFAGYSFAVPTAIVRKVVDDLKEFGAVQRGLLGVQIRDVNADLAKELDLPVVQGVYVAEVTENSGAKDAGIEKGDIIIGVNGQKVNTTAQLQEHIARKRPGDKVRVTFLRKGKERSTDVELRNRLGTTELVKNDADAIKIDAIGAEIRTLNEDEVKKLGEKGVKVVDVYGGKFKEAQIPNGFIITHIDKQKVDTAADVITLLSGKTGGVLIEGYHPSGRRGFFAIAM